MVVDSGHSWISSITQCAPLVTSAKSIGYEARPIPYPRFSALLTRESTVPTTIAGWCMSSRHCRCDSPAPPITTCSAT